MNLKKLTFKLNFKFPIFTVGKNNRILFNMSKQDFCKFKYLAKRISNRNVNGFIVQLLLDYIKRTENETRT